MRLVIGSGNENVGELYRVAAKFIQYADEVLGLRAGFSFGNPEKDGMKQGQLYRFVTLSFAFYAKQNLEATASLCQSGLSSQAMVLIRPLWEFMANLKYIEQEPELRTQQFIASADFKDAYLTEQAKYLHNQLTVARTNAILDYKREGEKRRRKEMKDTGKPAPPLPEPNEADLPQVPLWMDHHVGLDHSEVENRVKDHRNELGEIDPHNWSGLDLRSLAQKLEWPSSRGLYNLAFQEYLPVFANTSDFVHCSPHFSSTVISETPSGEFLLDGDQEARVRLCLGASIQNLARILRIHLSAWGFGDGSSERESFNQINQEFIALTSPERLT